MQKADTASMHKMRRLKEKQGEKKEAEREKRAKVKEMKRKRNELVEEIDSDDYEL